MTVRNFRFSYWPVFATQIRGRQEVRLLISENASTDATREIVEEEVGSGTPLDYLRNAENIGPDGNFLHCFERRPGKYVWITSDDDLLLPRTIHQSDRWGFRLSLSGRIARNPFGHRT